MHERPRGRRMLRAAALLVAPVLALVVPAPAGAQVPTISQFSAGYSASTHQITVTWSTNADASICPAVIYGIGGSSNSTYNTANRSCERPSGSKTLDPISQGGRYTFVLWFSAGGVGLSGQTSVDVPIVAPPTLQTAGQGSNTLQLFVDEYTHQEIHTQAQPELSWTPGAGSTTELQLGGGAWRRLAAGTTSYPVPQSELTGPTTQYQLRSCDTSASVELCSPAVSVEVDVVGAMLQGDFRRNVPAGGTTTVSWSEPGPPPGTGDFWQIAWTVNGQSRPGAITGNTSYAVPAANAGDVVIVYLESCNLTSLSPPAGSCGQTTPITAPVSGTITNLIATPQFWTSVAVLFGVPVASITPDGGGQPVPLTAPVGGMINPAGGISNGAHVSAGQKVIDVATTISQQELIVGATATFQQKSWTTDFNATSSRAYPIWIDGRLGAPGDPVISSQGHIFEDAEFNQAVPEIDPSSSAPASVLPNAQNVAVRDIPLAYVPGTNVYEKSKPYASFFQQLANTGQTPTSGLSERAIEGGGRIWVGQGGKYGCPPVPPGSTLVAPCGWNHSRIVSFDPNATPDPSQGWDTRFCVYSVPGNDNEVVGLAWDGKRIWFSQQGSGTIAWFDPTQLSCDTMLDYSKADSSNPANVAGQHQYCSATVIGNCVHLIPACPDGNAAPPLKCIPESGGSGMAEMTPDPDGHTIWYVTAYTSRLGEVDYDPNDPTNQGALAVSYFGSPPPAHGLLAGNWQVRADQNYVYYTEFGGGELVQFQKSSHAISQIHVPLQSSDQTTFGVEIHNHRLYFTMGGGAANDAAFGYVNLDPTNGGWGSSPMGVIYTGVTSLTDPSRAQVTGPALGGFSIDQSTGEIAVGDGYFRLQLLLLRPASGSAASRGGADGTSSASEAAPSPGTVAPMASPSPHEIEAGRQILCRDPNPGLRLPLGCDRPT